jgi:hypothetical protein
VELIVFTPMSGEAYAEFGVAGEVGPGQCGLWSADLTTATQGEDLTVVDRFAEIVSRYGPMRERQAQATGIRETLRLVRSGIPNGIRTRAAALKARAWAFFDTFQHLSLSAESCCD